MLPHARKSAPVHQATRLKSVETESRRLLEFLALPPLVRDLRFYPLLDACVLPVLDGYLQLFHTETPDNGTLTRRHCFWQEYHSDILKLNAVTIIVVLGVRRL